jgi:hypothetical protein
VGKLTLAFLAKKTNRNIHQIPFVFSNNWWTFPNNQIYGQTAAGNAHHTIGVNQRHEHRVIVHIKCHVVHPHWHNKYIRHGIGHLCYIKIIIAEHNYKEINYFTLF